MSKSSIPLTKAEAFLRSSLIEANIKYKLFLCVRKGAKYQGYSEIKFKVTEKMAGHSDGTFLEFAGQEISSFVVNGQDLSKQIHDLWLENRIWLKNSILNTGENTILVGFENKYNNDSFGLVSAMDVDGKQYVYIQTVPHYAHRVTPMFDQPNLKGTFQIQVAVPGDWHSVTTGDLLETASIGEIYSTDAYSQDKAYINDGLAHFMTYGYLETKDQFKFNMHATSPILASYNLNLVCGPFAKFDLDKDSRYNDIPMSIYCRESLAEFLVPELDNIFEFQKAGIKFYDGYFKFKYPYTRMDMLFCPEFAWGAMEYPGAVTYAEWMLPREKNSNSLRNSRGSIILHEIAHMWFGNLVTMKWWDDLWLNESFAEYICHLAFYNTLPELNKTMVTEHPWVMFLSKKYRGYLQDSEKTTHPISGEVNDTEKATTIFDGITYQKGASTLKCLLAMVGEEKFGKAMEDYFHKFQYGNTELSDLLECIQKQTDINIDEWRNQWISKAGFNYLFPTNLDFGQGKKSLLIKQGIVNEDHDTLRIHSIKIGFFDESCQVVAVKDVLIPSKNEFLINVSDVPAYKAVLLNYEDQDFVQVRLDKESYSFFKKNLNSIEDKLTRAILIRTFFDSLLIGETSNKEWNDIVCEFIISESNEQMHSYVFQLAMEALTRNTPQSIYGDIQNQLYQAIKTKIISSKTDYEKQFLLKEFIKYATTQDKADFFVDWLFGKNQVLNFEPSIVESWKIAEMVNAYKDVYGEDKAAESIRISEQRDNTDTKVSFKLKLEALGANTQKRQKLIEIYMSGDHDWSNGQLSDSISGFVSKFIDKSVKRTYYAYFFDNLLESMRKQPQTKAKTLYTGLFPVNDMEEYCLERLEELIKQVQPSEAFIHKSLQENIDKMKLSLSK